MSVPDGVNDSAELGGGDREDDVRFVVLAEADGDLLGDDLFGRGGELLWFKR
ncbi:hypothetical protein HEP87_32835 [Streptomyces sp. S1D4-11]|nr:hypothetical protein [Streptomyces sp. S1D4-11]QIY97887.1 hypothetical protein HEP87_32835 [Streptomyces sp. S1D4-11]